MSENSKIRYSQDFKDKMVSEINSLGKSVKEVSQEYGVSTSTLYKWRREAIEYVSDETLLAEHKLVLDYIIALVNLQGLVDTQLVHRIYNEQNTQKIEMELLDDILMVQPMYLRENYIYVDGKYFVHESIIMFDEVKLMLAQKENKPFYLPEKKELLKYVDSYYFEKTIYYQRLLNKLHKVFPSRSSLDIVDLVDEIQGLASMDAQLDRLMASFSRLGFEFFSEADVTATIPLIIDFVNHTRRWTNNGYTPMELSKKYPEISLDNIIENPTMAAKNLPKKKELSIGRNDPCPCGSGKKYKKCCLNKA